MTFEQIKAAVFGAVRVSEKEGKFFFHRFTSEQENMYKNRIADFAGLGTKSNQVARCKEKQ